MFYDGWYLLSTTELFFRTNVFIIDSKRLWVQLGYYIITIATQNKNITIPFIKSINPWALDIDWTCVHISSLQYTCGMACGRD